MNTTNNGIEDRHAVQGMVILHPWSWDKLEREFAKPQPHDVLISMINNIFRRYHNDITRKKALCFLLNLADKYDLARELDLKNPNDHELDQYHPTANQKHEVVTKAMAMLLQHLFGKNGHSHILPYEEPLFSKLMWFFRARPGISKVSNLHPENPECLGSMETTSRHIATIRNFAEEFAITAWDVVKAFPGVEDGDARDAIARIHAHTQVYWREVLDLMVRMGLLPHLKENLPTRKRYDEMVHAVFRENIPEYEKATEPTPDSTNERVRQALGKTGTLEYIVKYRNSSVGDFLYGIAPLMN